MKSRNLILSIIMAVSAVTAHAYDIEVDGAHPTNPVGRMYGC